MLPKEVRVTTTQYMLILSPIKPSKVILALCRIYEYVLVESRSLWGSFD